jgi:hypothetical protein
VLPGWIGCATPSIGEAAGGFARRWPDASVRKVIWPARYASSQRGPGGPAGATSYWRRRARHPTSSVTSKSAARRSRCWSGLERGRPQQCRRMMHFGRTERGLLARWWTVDHALRNQLRAPGAERSGVRPRVSPRKPPASASPCISPSATLYLMAALLLFGASLLSPRGVHRLAGYWRSPGYARPHPAIRAGNQRRGGLPIGRLVLQPGELAGVVVVVVACWRAPGLGNCAPARWATGCRSCWPAQRRHGSDGRGAVRGQLFLAGLPWLMVLGLARRSPAWQAYGSRTAGSTPHRPPPATTGSAARSRRCAAPPGSAASGEGRVKIAADAHSDSCSR